MDRQTLHESIGHAMNSIVWQLIGARVITANCIEAHASSISEVGITYVVAFRCPSAHKNTHKHMTYTRRSTFSVITTSLSSLLLSLMLKLPQKFTTVVRAQNDTSKIANITDTIFSRKR